MRGHYNIRVAMPATSSAVLVPLLFFFFTAQTHGYRVRGSEDENKPFVPYEKGFVGNVQDPAAAQRTRVNQGYESSVLLGDSVGKNRLFSCPKMVGPFDDQKYYCRGKEYGYCDRRSGTCFCNDGYMGNSCEFCSPTYFELGGLCYPKQVCPNDCSHAGDCNFLTGTCECDDHREGADCSKSKCSRYHQFCTHCNDDGCIECEEGFSVDETASWGFQCEPCYRFDPRCRNCNATACTMCVDLLLLSIHRSGRRLEDPPLPIDELTRELSITVPFGSTQDDAYYDAEHYFLIDPALVPLNESAVECHQGLNSDDSISCLQYNMTSHIMCGNHGTITFDSPEYAIAENAKHIRLTLKRSGGGVGEVRVSYSIYPITAGYEDVTPTAHYTSSQTIIFRPGQIRASFLVTINDDRIMEKNETFSVHLSNPTGFASLGTQDRTIVTIIDDDEHKTCSNHTNLGHDKKDLGYTVAGNPLEFKVFAKSCGRQEQNRGDDIIKVIARKIGANDVPGGFDAPVTIGEVNDLDDGTYVCAVNATITGKYEVNVYQLIPGGLKGYYYTDNFLSDSRLDMVRIDSVVNFTWGTGPVTSFGTDFVSVRWEGFVQPSLSESYTFWLDIDDHARLWIDGILLIDFWSFPPKSGMLHAEHDLTAFETYEIVLEYRDILNNATARLLWSSTSTQITAIPSSSLLYKEPIGNSPFIYTVTPAHAGAKESVALGQGLYIGTAGKQHVFTIQPMDIFGNFRGWPKYAMHLDTRHLDQFRATAELGESLVVPVSISYDEPTRMFNASYTPTVSGQYQLNIFLREEHILGSPFVVESNPGATFAPRSVAFGGHGNCLPWITLPCSGIHHGIALKNSTFNIDTFDLHGNRRGVGGDNWLVTVASTLNSSDYHFGRIADLKNGTYKVFVTPHVSGPNKLTVTLNGSHLQWSPFIMDVAHNEVSGAASIIVEDGNDHVMTSMTENKITVQGNDAWGNNAVHCHDNPYSTSVAVEGVNIDSKRSLVEYIGGGKYDITVVPMKTGLESLKINMNGHDIPFNVTVVAGAFSAYSTSASGVGLQKAKAGEEATFVIQSKDEGGNDKMKDEASIFEVRLVLVERPLSPVDNDESLGQDDVVVFGTQEFGDNGKYLVKYTATVSGNYLLHVRSSKGVDIVGSPFSVSVIPAELSAERSIVAGQGIIKGVAGSIAEVSLYACDEFGNFVRSNVDTVEMTLTLRSRHQTLWESNGQGLAAGLEDPINNHVIRQLARDDGNGRFVLDYTPQYSGNYSLDLLAVSPGGLWGSYYSSTDFSPDNLVITVHDDEVDKHWNGSPFSCDDDNECDSIGHLTGTSLFGISWNGRLSANHDEEYLIGIYCNEGGFASMAIDGKYVPWQSCWPIMTAAVVMKSQKTVNFSLRYKNEDGEAFVVLKWSSPSEGAEMIKIPRKNLHRQITVGNTLHPTIFPSEAFPPMSVAVGTSLRNAIAGVKHDFIVESRDINGNNGVWGNLLLGGGAQVSAYGFNHQDQLETTVIDNANGTYIVDFTPRTSGTYLLSVTLGVKRVHDNFGRFQVNKSIALSHIKGSPFLLNVQPGATDPQESTLIFADKIEGITGRGLLLELQAMDCNGNTRHEGGDKILAFVTQSPNGSMHNEHRNCLSEYAGGGRYSLKCPPISESGSFQLNVHIIDDYGDLHPIKFSPFDVTIYPGNATPETTQVISGGIKTATGSGGITMQFFSKAGLFGTFIVSAKDRFGNDVNNGGNHFVARVSGDTNVAPKDRIVSVIDQGNGKHVFAYKISYPSTYKIDVGLVTRSGLLGEYYLSRRSFKGGTPDKTLIDQQIDFRRRRQIDYQLFGSFRWTGYILFPHTGVFQFNLDGIVGHCILTINDNVILDASGESNTGNFDADENILYDVKIEYFSDANRLVLQLFWSSRKLSMQIVPKSYLFNSIEPIKDSPFGLVVS